MFTIDPYPNLRAAVFESRWPTRLGERPTPPALRTLLRLDAPAPIARSEEVRTGVRDVLRQRGYKPTGRGKPASEYLVRAVEEGTLPSINAAVDVCNVVSLHSGLPISVIDLDKSAPPFRIAPGDREQAYEFNASGQTIDVEALLCLHDAAGPCANPVKDAQRTKTDAGTRRTLTVIWGLESNARHTDAALRWYLELLRELGASTSLWTPDPR
jgi:DNA/RNA-binding domain of Phe-tRNA-synthetase-like protein